MLDCDLAALYEVPTFRFNKAVKRNRRRFPVDFMFQLTRQETANFDIAICDVKFPWRPPDASLCLYGTWSGYGGKYPAQ